MKAYKNYIIAFFIYCICLFSAPYIYAFFDFHVADSVEHYELDKRDWERQNHSELGYMSYGEWHDTQQQRDDDRFNYICNECASVFDPWHEPTGTYDRDFGREE